ncbi:hypothetical protein HO173_003143 [Letharia columbiana]|uniref:Uncharacterized protein n=1 Tax=Letharia columbiana TaxID=112416 RepID=A0A8H6G1C7_9LECA|nr:uncharacterized protein HO173_003143 [Letharia columbiana]KAF6238637.1 hypothetical protein HO173_003143 [Letharia columbiana]
MTWNDNHVKGALGEIPGTPNSNQLIQCRRVRHVLEQSHNPQASPTRLGSHGSPPFTPIARFVSLQICINCADPVTASLWKEHPPSIQPRKRLETTLPLSSHADRALVPTPNVPFPSKHPSIITLTLHNLKARRCITMPLSPNKPSHLPPHSGRTFQTLSAQALENLKPKRSQIA